MGALEKDSPLEFVREIALERCHSPSGFQNWIPTGKVSKDGEKIRITNSFNSGIVCSTKLFLILDNGEKTQVLGKMDLKVLPQRLFLLPQATAER